MILRSQSAKYCGVVARTAKQDVIASTAVEGVVSRAAVEYVVAGQPAKDIALIGRRSDRREPENTAPVVDEVEVASRILAEGRGIVDRPGIDRQLRGAVGGDPRASIEAQREDPPLNEVREEILPLQRRAVRRRRVAP